MKNINTILVAIIIILGIKVQAQDQKNAWAFTFGMNAVDTRGSATNTIFDQYFKAKENWNITSGTFLKIDRRIGNSLSAGVGGSMNRIYKYVYKPLTGDIYTANPGNLRFYSLDANVKYSFVKAVGIKWLEPYVRGGGGYTWFGENSYPVAKGEVGFNFWITQTVGINLGTAYNYSFSDRDTPDALAPLKPGYWQHFAGLTIKLGGKDTDKDGIYDKEDNCPDVAGLKEFNGCPDTDGDGIMDSEDGCPTVAGSKEVNGCPDADNDGVADKDDKCPSVFGVKENSGCPLAATNEDNKNQDNSQSVSKEEVALPPTTMTFYKPALYKIDANGAATLDSFIQTAKEAPKAKIKVEGHTDSTGSQNVKLSEERAKHVAKYLEAHGIKGDRIATEGFGDTKPIDSNKTVTGRAKNRRVEIKLEK